MNKNKEIIVLNHKRSNAINIGMTKLPPPRSIKTAILKMDATIMNREGIEVRIFHTSLLFFFFDFLFYSIYSRQLLKSCIKFKKIYIYLYVILKNRRCMRYILTVLYFLMKWKLLFQIIFYAKFVIVIFLLLVLIL